MRIWYVYFGAIEGRRGDHHDKMVSTFLYGHIFVFCDYAVGDEGRDMREWCL
jgi:hypothetical protein